MAREHRAGAQRRQGPRRRGRGADRPGAGGEAPEPEAGGPSRGGGKGGRGRGGGPAVPGRGRRRARRAVVRGREPAVPGAERVRPEPVDVHRDTGEGGRARLPDHEQVRRVREAWHAPGDHERGDGPDEGEDIRGELQRAGGDGGRAGGEGGDGRDYGQGAAFGHDDGDERGAQEGPR